MDDNNLFISPAGKSPLLDRERETVSGKEKRMEHVTKYRLAGDKFPSS